MKKQLDEKEFLCKILEKEKYWEGELRRLVIGSLPPFEAIKKDITEDLSKISGS